MEKNYFKNYFKNSVKKEISNKFFYKKSSQIPELKKITISFCCNKNSKEESLANAFLALTVISKKTSINFNTTKFSNVKLKLKKGSIVGCSVTLKKTQMYFFLSELITEILVDKKSMKTPVNLAVNKTSNFKTFSIGLKPLNLFKELKSNYSIFKNVFNITLTIEAKNVENEEEFFILMSNLKFPVTKQKVK